jgi:Uncharacterised nucleotidyltransferase
MAVSSSRRRLVALRVLCDWLDGCRRLGEVPPRTRCASPEPVGWDFVVALATELSVTPWLWRAVCDQLKSVPESVATELREQHNANTIRNLRLRHQLTDAVRALNSAGVVPLLLKGASQLVDGTLDQLGDREMADLDLLIHPQMPAAEAALAALGYRAYRELPWVEFELPFIDGRAAGPIDLHCATGDAVTSSILPLAELSRCSRELRVRDTQPAFPVEAKPRWA